MSEAAGTARRNTSGGKRTGRAAGSCMPAARVVPALVKHEEEYLLVVLAIRWSAAPPPAAPGPAQVARPVGIARAAMARATCAPRRSRCGAMVRDRPQRAEAHFRLGVVQLQLGRCGGRREELKLAQAAGWNRRVVLPLLARATLPRAASRTC